MNSKLDEINIPDNILTTLGDLTNGALNYYKAPKTIELKHKLLLDYMTNLQKENERLNNMLENDSNKNLELIVLINKISDIVEDKNITGFEVRLKIQEILGGDE